MTRRLPSLARRLWFPVAVAILLVVGFAVLGPPAAPPIEDRLAAMAPASAAEPSALPADATAAEREIASQYQVLQRYPDTVHAYVLLGNAYVQRVRERGDPSDYGRAEAAFAEALRREPENVDALVGNATLALARHEFREALAIAQRAVDLAPERARVYGPLVDAQTELGQYDEALVSAQTMLDLRPDLASYSRVSYQRELHGQLDAAIEAMKLAFDGSVGSSPENREYLRVLIGDLYLQSGDLATATAAYEASLAVSPDFVWALAGLGRARAAEGRFEEAIDLYERAVEAIPLPEFVIALGETQEAAGQADEARRSYELVRAIQQLFAANGVDVDLDLALFEANHGSDHEATVALARRAYEDQPNIRAADALAWALYRAGQHEEASRYATEALRLGTRYGSFHFHAGMIARARGDIEAARTHLRAALEMDPYFSALYAPQARTALTELGG